MWSYYVQVVTDMSNTLRHEDFNDKRRRSYIQDSSLSPSHHAQGRPSCLDEADPLGTGSLGVSLRSLVSNTQRQDGAAG